MEQKHTPGPWRWEFNEKHKTVSIVGGVPKFDLTVMDFERWGMGGAVPRFRDTAHDGMNVMHRLCDRPDWIAPAKGREHHASWFANVIHPDARRIVACVNACSGIATERLERHYNAGGGIDSAMEESALREQIAVYKQRDQLRHRVERAERALQRVGWTYIEGADEWKPPIGPSASPLLERIDQLTEQRYMLIEALESIKHSMQQGRIIGNDYRREMKLSEELAERAISITKEQQ